MPIFIRLRKKERVLLFSTLKKSINSSWEDFYPILGISRPMFFNYLGGRYDIPKHIFLKLEKFSGVKIGSYNEILKDKYVLKNIEKPKEDIYFAEILGVLNGDGYISKQNHEICVVGNLLEKEYFDYLKELFESTFKLKFSLGEFPTYIKLRTYSKELSNLLNKKYGLPTGNKLGSLKIPKQVLISRKFLRTYIRGLFDTDGGFTLRRKKDPIINFTSADPNFLNEVKKVLINLGFKVAKRGSKKIFIYHPKHVKIFFETVKPANSKHLKNYQNYVNLNKRG